MRRHDELEADAPDPLLHHGAQEGVPCKDAVFRKGDCHRARLPDELRVTGEKGGFGKKERVGGYNRRGTHLQDKIRGGCGSGRK